MWASIAKRLTPGLLLGMVALLGPLPGARAQDLSQVVEKLTQAQFSVSYRGERHVYNFHPSTPQVTTFNVYHTPRGERREYHTGRFSFIIIDDGHHRWIYRPHQNLITRRPSTSMEQRRNLAQRNAALLMKNYRIEVLQPEETMSGRPCMVTKFASRYGVDRPVRTLWIDREKGLPLRTEVYDSRGLRVMSFFSSITYSPPSEAEALTLKVPPTTRLRAESEEEVISPEALARAVDFPVYQPKHLPPGFVLVDARLKGSGPDAELRLLYSDGLSALTLFERRQSFDHRKGGPPATVVSLGEAEGRLYRYGLLLMVEWQRPPLALALVGEVSEKELLATARSIP